MFRREVNSLLVWFIILNNDVVGDNVTGKYYRTMPKSVFKTRQRKLIGFDTDGFIRVRTHFFYPLYKI